MCTLGAKYINSGWFLIKTRDPVPWMRWDDEIKLFNTKADKLKKHIIQNPDPHEDGYYGGINEKGVVFVASFVPVAENQISFIRRPYIRLILDAPSAKQALKVIRSFNPKIGGNLFLADKNDCYEIEAVPEKYLIKKINKPVVKTNHFLYLPYSNFQMKDSWFKKWTIDRLIRAQELIEKAKSLDDLKTMLRDRKNSNRATAICLTKKESKNHPPTISAFIFDTKNKLTYYCRGNPINNPFKKYSF